ncbi:type II secretion system protein [Vagococcus acidifermentans]|uniref:Prepilin-type cleavage/methylation domain-containing protein n=1 Tax=Vagococcus acidifermentans TaxID=564710 RepID=A0A430B2Q2_9ENTE|nr:type II secretion system protein [Vagococcus acidifermentans]RSU14588.1 hypothetical protein CBF27_00980 [Vagococcus acidifermentans]
MKSTCQKNKYRGYLLLESMVALAVIGGTIVLMLSLVASMQTQAQRYEQQVSLAQYAWEIAAGQVGQHIEIERTKYSHGRWFRCEELSNRHIRVTTGDDVIEIIRLANPH